LETVVLLCRLDTVASEIEPELLRFALSTKGMCGVLILRCWVSVLLVVACSKELDEFDDELLARTFDFVVDG
jgi:hypothetical protein